MIQCPRHGRQRGEARLVVSRGGNAEQRAQVVCSSRGGGPLPILGDPRHKAMIDFMKRLPSQLRRPDAVLVISAHWEEAVVTLQGARNPPMFYDYYGFPKQAYVIKYPARGNPSLAGIIAEHLRSNRIACSIDVERGFDHGLFIPLTMMYPRSRHPRDPDVACAGAEPVRAHRPRQGSTSLQE